MRIFSPGDRHEMKWAMLEAFKVNGPVYIRYSKVGNSDLHQSKNKLSLGRPFQLVKGKNVALIVSGGVLEIASTVVKDLQAREIDVSLYSLPSIKPIDAASIRKIIREYKSIFVIEEHNIIGGLGSAISEIEAESSEKSRITRIGIPDKFTGVTGSIPYLLDINGLSVKKISQRISKTISTY